jgi:hypothetical protein
VGGGGGAEASADSDPEPTGGWMGMLSSANKNNSISVCEET